MSFCHPIRPRTVSQLICKLDGNAVRVICKIQKVWELCIQAHIIKKIAIPYCTINERPVNPEWTGYCEVCHGPGGLKLDLSFGPIARDQPGLNWKILVHQGYSVYDVSLRHRDCLFWELAQIGPAPTVHLERARELARLITRHLCTIYGPGPETNQNPDSCHAGLQTTAWQDFSHPWVVCNSSSTKRMGGGGQQVDAAQDFCYKYGKILYVKTLFF